MLANPPGDTKEKLMTQMNRETFFQSLPLDRYMPQDIRRIQHAYWLAKEAHRRQSRDDGDRYFEHPRAVAMILAEYGWIDPDVIIAALLHDAVEDSFTPMTVYMALFGPHVTDMIRTLSKKTPVMHPIYGHVIRYQKKPIDVYFANIARHSLECCAVKGADRTHNMRTCDGFDLDRKRRQVKETHVYVLPIVKSADAKLAAMLFRELKRVEAQIGPVGEEEFVV